MTMSFGGAFNGERKRRFSVRRKWQIGELGCFRRVQKGVTGKILNGFPRNFEGFISVSKGLQGFHGDNIDISRAVRELRAFFKGYQALLKSFRGIHQGLQGCLTAFQEGFRGILRTLRDTQWVFSAFQWL